MSIKCDACDKIIRTKEEIHYIRVDPGVGKGHFSRLYFHQACGNDPFPSKKEPEKQETKPYKPTLICGCGTELKESDQEGYWVCPKCRDVAAVKDGKITSFSTDPPEEVK